MLDFLWRLMEIGKFKWLYVCRSQLKKWHERDFFWRKHEAGPAGKGFFFANQLPCSAGSDLEDGSMSAWFLFMVDGQLIMSAPNMFGYIIYSKQAGYIISPNMMLNFIDAKHQDMQSNTYLHIVANPPPVYIKINLKHQSILSTQCWPFITY